MTIPTEREVIDQLEREAGAEVDMGRGRGDQAGVGRVAMDERTRSVIVNIVANLEGDETKLTREQLEFKLRVARERLKALLQAVPRDEERERREAGRRAVAEISN